MERPRAAGMQVLWKGDIPVVVGGESSCWMTNLSMLACVKSAFWVTDAEELFRSVKQLPTQADGVCRAFQVRGDLGTRRAPPLSGQFMCFCKVSPANRIHSKSIFLVGVAKASGCV